MALLSPLLLLVLVVSTTCFTPQHPRWQLSSRRSMLPRSPESLGRVAVRRKAAEDDQSRAPIVEALQEAASNIRAPFFFPGHKMGMEFPLDFDAGGTQEDGATSRTAPWCYDLPEIPELDNLFSPEGPIKEAEELAAKAFGANKTWFLVNGSTAGVLAAIMACVRRHQQQQQQEGQVPSSPSSPCSSSQGPWKPRASKVVLPLNVHKSAINALVLSGGEPLFVSPVYDPQLDLCHGLPLTGPGGLAEVVREEARSGQLACVLLVSPTYHGVLGDVAGAAALCREVGVPLIVDEAHGAHLRFMPRGSLLRPGGGGEGKKEGPWDALSLGADIVVQSTHKTLAALSQAGMLHVGAGVDAQLCDFLSSALQMVQSSSPNYLLLASLDAARRHVAHPLPPPLPHGPTQGGPISRGRASLQKAVELANDVRHNIMLQSTPSSSSSSSSSSGGGLGVLSPPSDGSTLRGAFTALDPLRLTVHGRPRPLSGYALDELMIGEWGVYAELPASRTLTFAVGPGSRPEDGRALVEALNHAVTQLTQQPHRSTEEEEQEAKGEEEEEGKGEEETNERSYVEETNSAETNEEASHVEPPPSFPPYDPLGLQRRRLCSPRDAYLTPTELLPTGAPDILGRASAEIVCPYPPGIPVLLPGEVVSREALDYLWAVLRAGGSVMGCADVTLKTLRVLKKTGNEE